MASFRDTPWTDIERIRDSLSKALGEAPTIERAAGVFTATFKRAFETCALARVFVVLPMHRLGAAEQAWAQQLASSIGRTVPIERDTPVLCLLGTAGSEAAWNDRTRSAGHRAIPLLDHFITNAPMIAALLDALQVSPDTAAPSGAIQLRRMPGGLNARFFVEDAERTIDDQGRHVIASREFVTRHGIHTVFGMGGSYVTGELAIAIIFTTEQLTVSEVDRYTTFISSFKMATADAMSAGRIFDQAAT